MNVLVENAAGLVPRTHTILIVDDTPANLSVIAGCLEGHGFEVLVAQDGEGGLEKARLVRPDLILLDVLLPGIDGFETCRRLKIDEATQDIPVIFMTVLTETQHKLTGFQIGAIDYITKPFQEQEVLARVTMQLRLRDLTERLEQQVQARTDELRAANEQLSVEMARRVQMMEALRESEEKYRALYEDSPSMYFTVDAGGIVLSVNQFGAEQLGYTVGELVGQSVLNVFYPDDREAVQQHLAACLQNPAQVAHWEFRKVRRDGSMLWVKEVVRIVQQGDGALVALVVCDDITARKQAEEAKQELEDKLERAQRMEALGILAGGVAHDLNNILGPLVAYPDLILMELPADSVIRNDIFQMQQAARRAAAVVQDLLTLARRGVYQMVPLDLNTVIKQYLDSPSFIELKDRHPNVSIDVNLAPDLLNIMGAAPHLSKVVMNLVTNAFEAMSHGGVLTIYTLCQSLDRPLAGYVAHGEQPCIQAGDYVVLHVGDTGTGIEEKDLDRIFEPFYTKKEMGRSGSGLGLAIVHGVVHDHKGRIDLRTEVGKGSEFIIYLPITIESIQIGEKDHDYRGNETVLVIDDLENQRQLATRLLTSLGYRVTAVTNGRAAIEYLQKNSVDILVLDMIMDDGFDGLDTYREIAKRHPGQKAIIASGFSETDRVKEAQRLGAGPFVKKPYTLDNIGQAIRQAFSGNTKGQPKTPGAR
ncbi:MAG: response regulator [Anaerolineae bacterium]|nr:response regulator [Anaerolineae bacterium]